MLNEKLEAGHVPNAATKAPEQPENKEPWLIKGWPLPEVDMNKLPTRYTMRIISGYEEADPEIARMRELHLKEQELMRREIELSWQKRKEEEVRQRKVEEQNTATAKSWLIVQAMVNLQNRAAHAVRIQKLKEDIQEMYSKPRTPPLPPEIDTIQAGAEAIAPLILPKPPPLDLIKRASEEIRAINAQNDEDVKDGLRAYLELDNDLKVKRRHRLHLLAPDLIPDYQ
jgi:hypothetical protein